MIFKGILLIAASKIYNLFGNLEIRDIVCCDGRIIFKTIDDWYAYNPEDDSVTVYADENHTTYY